MTDRLILLKKLAMLREHAGRVRRRRPASQAAFEADVDVQDAASVDPGRLWLELPPGVDTLDRYVEAIARLAEPAPPVTE